MSSVFYHALAFVFHDLFRFGAQLAPWPKGMQGVFGATLALTWIKPYIQESADNRLGKPFTKAVFYLTPLLLIGGASYYVYRSKKVALFAGGYFATVHNLIDYSRYCNAWHQVIENGKIKKDPSTYYERQAEEEFKKKKIQENLFEVKREAHFEKALCQISKGEVNEGLKLYRNQIDHYDLFRDGGEREIKLFKHTLNYYITQKGYEQAAELIKKKRDEWKNSSKIEKDSYAEILIQAYAKLNDLKTLEEFLYHEIEACKADKTHSLYSAHYVFTLAKGYGHIDNKAEEILELVTQDWLRNEKMYETYLDQFINKRMYETYLDLLISDCVEKQSNRAGLSATTVDTLSTQDFNFKQYLKEVIEIHLERLNNKSPTSQIKNNTPEKNSAAKRYIRDCKSIDSKKKTFIQLIDQDCSAEEFNKLIEETFGKDFAPDKVKCYIALALFSKNSKYLKNAAQALKDLTDANKFTGNLPFEIAKIYLDLGQINFAYALFQDESLPLRYQKKDYCVGIEGLVIYHIEKVGIDTFSTLLQNGELFNNRSEDKKAAVKVYLAEQYRLGDKYDEALQILDGVLGTGK